MLNSMTTKEYSMVDSEFDTRAKRLQRVSELQAMRNSLQQEQLRIERRLKAV